MENLETVIVTDRDDIKGRGTKDLGISKPSVDKGEAVSFHGGGGGGGVGRWRVHANI